ncbi:MAG: hypothetical protein JWN98_213 [Abditibacteriota bacterium]|nr:hypothetical protein [Abditibacteriota bacterium]
MFEEIVISLQKRDPLPPLYPKSFDADLSRRIQSADDSELFGPKVLSTQQKQLLRAGLLVWNDDIDAAHPIVQDIEDATGSFWHAIIHRREGDASNANYWWRRTGNHPAFPQVLHAVQSTLGNERESCARDFLALLNREGHWQPREFVERCELARKQNHPDEWLRRVQLAEIESLLNWCRQPA